MEGHVEERRVKVWWFVDDHEKKKNFTFGPHTILMSGQW